MDNLVNLESSLVNRPVKFNDAHIKNYAELENEIINIKSLKELENRIGNGVLAMNYHTDGDDKIYGWSYDGGFMAAYVVNNDDVISISTATTLDKLAVSSTNCH